MPRVLKLSLEFRPSLLLVLAKVILPCLGEVLPALENVCGVQRACRRELAVTLWSGSV